MSNRVVDDDYDDDDDDTAGPADDIAAADYIFSEGIILATKLSAAKMMETTAIMMTESAMMMTVQVWMFGRMKLSMEINCGDCVVVGVGALWKRMVKKFQVLLRVYALLLYHLFANKVGSSINADQKINFLIQMMDGSGFRFRFTYP